MNKKINIAITIGIPLFGILIACCKKKPVPLPINYYDARINGIWKCEGLYLINNPDSTHTSNLDTVYSKIYKNKFLEMRIESDSIVTIDNYHWSITGLLKLSSVSSCSYNLVQKVDFLNRPKSDYQPLVLDGLNQGKKYWLEGDGSKNTRLNIYFKNEKWVARFIKF
jgi:hypothetical protein